MIRLLGTGVVGIVLFALWIFCVLDVIASDEALIRNLPKLVWLMIVIFVPAVGSVAWLAVGRPPYAGWRPGDTERRTPRRVQGPEDAPWFPTSGSGRSSGAGDSVAEDRLRAWEDDLRQREERLRRKEDGSSGGGDSPSS